MTRLVPFENKFAIVKRLQKIGTVLLWTSAFLALIGFTLGNINLSVNIGFYKKLVEVFLAAFSIIYSLLELIQSFIFLQAQIDRTKDLLDNSFGTNLSDANSRGYYSNDNVQPGTLKLGVNCFENSFFTSNLTKKLILKESIKLSIIFILYLSLFIGSNQELGLIFLQIALPLTFLVQYIKLMFLHYQSKQVFDEFKNLFGLTVIHRETKILFCLLKYEKLLSWAVSPIPDKIFDKYNTALSAEWEQQKIRYIDSSFL